MIDYTPIHNFIDRYRQCLSGRTKDIRIEIKEAGQLVTALSDLLACVADKEQRTEKVFNVTHPDMDGGKF